MKKATGKGSTLPGYKITSWPIMAEKLPVELKFPVGLLREPGLLDSYPGKVYCARLFRKVYSELSQRGIKVPLDFDWKSFLTNEILPNAEPHVNGYSNVDRVKSFKIVGREVCLDCVVSNPDFDPNKRQLITKI